MMFLPILAVCSMLGLILLVLAVVVALIRGKRFGLKRLFGLAALFGLLMVPVAEIERRGARVPRAISLPLDGEKRWKTPPLADADYQVTVFYKRQGPGYLRERIELRVVDDTTDEVVLATQRTKSMAQRLMVYGAEDHERLGQFHAVGSHCYRIEIADDQAEELAHKARLQIRVTPEEVTRFSGLSSFE